MEKSKSGQSNSDSVSPATFTIPQNLLVSQSQQTDDELDLAELFKALWAGKLVIIFITALFTVSSVFYALNQPNIYKASVLLSPASGDGGSGGLAGLAGQFGGLASLAGINLNGGGGDKTLVALEILKSRSFIEDFIIKHELLVPLIAAKGWNIASNTLILDEQVYNAEKQAWLREVKAPKTPEPSLWEAYKAFSRLMNISQDKISGMITISIEFYSPELAKEWLVLLVKDINAFIKEQDQQEAQNSITYLTSQLEQTDVANMQTVFYQLIEEQSKNMMLTQIKQEYVLKTIDPAQAPEEKAKPKRAVIVMLGVMLGGMLSVLIVLIRYFIAKNKIKN